MDTVWTVVSIIVGAIYGAGIAVIQSPAQTRFAKILLWGSAVVFGVWCFAWELMTDATTSMRVIAGLAVGAFVFVVVPETIRRLAPNISDQAKHNEPLKTSEETDLRQTMSPTIFKNINIEDAKVGVQLEESNRNVFDGLTIRNTTEAIKGKRSHENVFKDVTIENKRDSE